MLNVDEVWLLGAGHADISSIAITLGTDNVDDLDTPQKLALFALET